MSHIGKYGEGRWIRNRQLAKYLNVSEMCVWRWKRDANLNFPAASDINGIEYNDLDAIDAWMRSRVVNRTVTTELETIA
jgi:predicted DNA-binding transcriptional regulator AlpA